MSEQNVKRYIRTFSFLVALVLCSCAKLDDISGPVQIRLIKPGNGHCKYDIGGATVQTLSSLRTVQGLMGKVGYFNGDELIDADVHFGKTGDTYQPMDYGSLYAASLYYYIETGYLLFRDKLPTNKVDMAEEVPNLSSTAILLEAQLENDGELVEDNAAYLFSDNLNIFISYPSGDFITGLPFGINMGIMVHEYTHFVMNHLVRQPLGTATGAARDTLSALDEGMADYFGYLATLDPAYFLCTEESLNRDLSVPKQVDTSRATECRRDSPPRDAACLRIPGSPLFSEHSLGSVFAAANYQAAIASGDPFAHGATLVNLMRKIGRGECGSAANITFSSIIGCHPEGNYNGTNLRSLN